MTMSYRSQRHGLILYGMLVAAMILIPSTSCAENQSTQYQKTISQFDYDAALATSQGAISNVVRDRVFLDAEGNPVDLSSFRGKPLVVSMVYTSCYQICPMTVRYLSEMVGKAQDALGKDSFEVAVIGFDTPFDTPDAMQYFAQKQGIENQGWHLLSFPQNSRGSFLDDIGFVFYPSSAGFDHLIQATIVDANGKVYRQVYGQVFDTPMLVDPLIELVLGTPKDDQTLAAGIVQKIKLFCTTYDPVRDGYYFDYSLFLGMLIGGVIILLTAFAILKERHRGRNLTNA